MHIAFWSPAWPLEKFQNGIVTYVHSMKRELERQGHRVSVFTQGPADGAAGEPHIHRVRPPPRRLWRRAAQRVLRRLFPPRSETFRFPAAIAAEISRVHRRDPIDIIEMEESFGWFAGVGKRTSIPLLVRLHGPAFLSLVDDELTTSFGQEKISLEGQALKTAAAIVSPSEVTLVRAIERYQLNPRERRHIVNPLTMDADTPLWSLDACDRNTILFVGRFDLHKGADLVLKAFLSMLKQRPTLKLVFAGPDRGIPAPGGQLLQFEPYCDLLFPPELKRRVEYRGPVANREAAKLRTQAMVTVVASRWETAGYTILEAMYQGCPVVSSDAGACPESVIDGVTGRLAKSGDADDFAAKLSMMLDDPQSAVIMGQAARRLVVERHSATRVAAASVELYSRVIANHAAIAP
jgi:glycosyltransferase involved in cell wall biosynthesis